MRPLYFIALLPVIGCAESSLTDETDNAPTEDSGDGTPTEETDPVDLDPTGVWEGACDWIPGAVSKKYIAYFGVDMRLAFTEDAGDVAAFGIGQFFLNNAPQKYDNLVMVGTGEWDGVDAVMLDLIVNGEPLMQLDGTMDGNTLDTVIGILDKEATKKAKEPVYVDALTCELIRSE